MRQESLGPQIVVYGDGSQLFCQEPRFEIDYLFDLRYVVRTNQEYHVTRDFFAKWMRLQSESDCLVVRWPRGWAPAWGESDGEYTRNGRIRKIIDEETHFELREIGPDSEHSLTRLRPAWKDSDRAKRIEFFLTASDEVEPIEYALLVLFHFVRFRTDHRLRYMF